MEGRRTIMTRDICDREISFQTHYKPHLDELWAIRLISRHATVGWLDRHAPDNVIVLGIGGGEFDEHPRNGNERKECCATLVAASLDLSTDPAYQQIVQFLFKTDTLGKGDPFDVYNAVKLLNEQYPDEPERVYAWADAFMAAKEDEQHDFVASTEVVRAALANGQVLTVTDLRGRELKILTIEGDGRTTFKAAIRQLKEGLAALIQRQPTGHVQIYTNGRSSARLQEVARLLRMAELRRQSKPSNLDGRTSRQDGFIDAVPEWYYFRIGEMLLNGSLTNPDMPATQIPLDEIGRCVRLGIEMSFQQGRPPRQPGAGRANQPVRTT